MRKGSQRKHLRVIESRLGRRGLGDKKRGKGVRTEDEREGGGGSPRFSDMYAQSFPMPFPLKYGSL